MPDILSPSQFDRWMGCNTPERDLLGALAPFPAERMEVVKVVPAVNVVANNSPECVAPAV